MGESETLASFYRLKCFCSFEKNREMSIKETLQAAAIQIRDERKLEANTAKRVGALLLALVEADLNMEDLEKSFLSGSKKMKLLNLLIL